MSYEPLALAAAELPETSGGGCLLRYRPEAIEGLGCDFSAAVLYRPLPDACVDAVDGETDTLKF
jgi:hypothetical protein